MTEITAFEADKTVGFLHVPAEALNRGIVLTHGAAANCQAPLLVAVANTLASAGWHVLRCDLPFRRQRRFGPPHSSRAGEDRNGLREAVGAMRELVSGRVVLSGHSYGGRQASILAAEDGSIADGLLLLSYPLHPPEKPDRLRTAHFEQLHTPSLFVHGTKDPFGTVEEMRAAVGLIPGSAELVTVEGAGHDLKRGTFDISGTIVARLQHRLG